MPPDPIDRAATRMTGPVGILLVVLVVVYVVSVIGAPEDSMQGAIQKILYVHVPCAFAAYLGFFLTALGGALYLWREKEQYDRLAAAAAEVGVLFCTLVILTGPIWARGTWGKWWAWDLRLTLTLLLWLVYLAYLLLREFTEGGPRTARFASVYGIAGLIVIPLNYFAIDIANRAQGGTMHPENLADDSLGAGMGTPFLIGIITALVAFTYLLTLRVRVGSLRAHLALRAARGDEPASEASSA
jgi:heme exporter protein C